MLSMLAVVSLQAQKQVKKAHHPNVEKSPYGATNYNKNADKNAIWEVLFNHEVSEAGAGQAGVETDGEYFYTTKWANDTIIKYDLSGNLIESFTITGVTGLRDLAYDGTYFYGGAASTNIYKMDFENKTLISTITNANIKVRHISYNSDSNAFWVGDWDSDIWLVDTLGNILNTISATSHGAVGTYGSAYDNWSANGPYLWLFSTSPAGKITQINIATGQPTGITHNINDDVANEAGTIGGGLFTHELVDSGYVVLGGLYQADPNGIFGYKLSSTSNTIDVAPISIVSPTSSCGLSNAETLIVEIKNHATDSVTGFDIIADFNGTLITRTVDTTLPPFATIEFDFDTTLDMSNTANYNFTIYTLLANDEDTSDDTLEVSIKNFMPTNLSNSPVTEDFEAGSFAEGWKLIDNNNDANSWQLITSEGNFGPKCTMYEYTSTNSANEYLFTSCVQLTAGETYQLEYYYKVSSATYPENLSVFLADAQLPGSVIDTISSHLSITATDYTLSSTQFTVSTTGTYYFAWYAHSPADMFNLYVDDISIYKKGQNDIGVLKITAPTTDCGLTNKEEVQVEVKNYGLDTIYAFDMYYMVDNNAAAIQTETVNETIAPGNTAIVAFSDSADFSNLSTSYTITAWTAHANDDMTYNDTVSGLLYNVYYDLSVQPYTTNFDVGADNYAWKIIDADNDTNTWVVDSLVGAGNNSTTGSAVCFSGTTANDDYLISPCMEMKSSKLYQLKFYYASSAYFSNYISKIKVLITDTPDTSALSSATTIIDLGAFSQTEFLESISAFNVPTDGIYYVVFYAYTDADQYYVSIDDVTIKELPPYDLELISIVAPTSNCGMTNTETVSYKIANVGSDTIYSFNASYVHGIDTVNDSYTGVFAPGDTMVFDFSQTIDASITGKDTLQGWVSVAGDFDSTNDTIHNYTYNHLSHDFAAGAYTMGFEANESIDGWMFEDVNGDNYTWNISTDKPNTGTQSIMYGYTMDNAADDWAYSRCFSLEASKTYRLSFYYAIESESFPEKLSVHLGTDQAAASMTTLLVDLGVLENSDYQQQQVSFTVPADGIYYLGWYAYSDANMWNLFVDDINLREIDCSGATAPVVDLGGAQSTCQGESITLDAGAGFDVYAWNNGESTQTITVSTTGTYTVTVTDSCGQIVADSALITINPNPTVDLGTDTEIDNGDSITLDAGAGFVSYIWSTGDSTQTITVSTSGTYSVTVTDANGCEGTGDIVISVTGINELTVANTVALYPNPAKEYVVVNSTETEINQIIVYNALGKSVYTELVNNTNKVEINTSNLSTGAYYVQIITIEGWNITKQFSVINE